MYILCMSCVVCICHFYIGREMTVLLAFLFSCSSFEDYYESPLQLCVCMYYVGRVHDLIYGSRVYHTDVNNCDWSTRRYYVLSGWSHFRLEETAQLHCSNNPDGPPVA